MSVEVRNERFREVVGSGAELEQLGTGKVSATGHLSGLIVIGTLNPALEIHHGLTAGVLDDVPVSDYPILVIPFL